MEEDSPPRCNRAGPGLVTRKNPRPRWLRPQHWNGSERAQGAIVPARESAPATRRGAFLLPPTPTPSPLDLIKWFAFATRRSRK